MHKSHVIMFFIVVLSFLALFCLKIYRLLALPQAKCYVCMVRKIVVITGGNQGMGYCVALDFAQRGARVILACRNRVKGEKAKQRIIEESNNSDVVVKHLNLASFRSIRTFAYKMLKTENRLDVLVNNAGVMRPKGVTEDGYHVTLQVNALGPFLLTYLLLDILKSTQNSRVINVTTLEGIRYSDLLPNFVDMSEGFFSHITNYNQSKKCLNLLMTEMADLLAFSKVSVHFSLPRNCTTDIHIYENLPDILKLIKKKYIFYFFHLSPEESSCNTIYCALSNDLSRSSGKFYRDCREYHCKEEDVDLVNLRRTTWNKYIAIIG